MTSFAVAAGPRAVAAGSTEPAATVAGLSKVFLTRRNEVVAALRDISLTLGRGEVLALLGPSGCGKSTLLRILAGLDEDYVGKLDWGGEREDLKPHSSVVFQSDALLPWRTVEQNVDLVLKARGLDRIERARRVDRYLRLVGLHEFKRAYPNELSGGMRQRASVARALSVEPSVLLMDEPLAALDAQTRLIMQQELLDILSATSSSMVYVTHDIEEAITLGTKVAVMSRRPGRIIHEAEVPFDWPRNALTLRREGAFRELSVELWKVIATQVGSDHLGGAHGDL